MPDFAALHLLRPWWLLALLPALALAILLWRRKSSGANWRRAIAPDLLEHLLDQRAERRQRWPWLVLLAAWCATALALAGPTWEKLPQPVLQQRDALVIVLDLSLSMYAADVKPSRLLRARYKVLDILERRREGVTGLVAYSGDAHVVAPLTDDTATIANLVPALTPDMMPLYGSDPVAGIDTALTLLHNAGFQRGRILLISDEIGDGDIDAIADRVGGRWQLSILGVGTAQGAPIALPAKQQQGGFLKQQDGTIAVAQLHRERFERLAARTQGRYVDVQLDDRDIDALLPRTVLDDSETRSVQREFDQWRERGPLLVALLLPFAALAFRRGWLLALLLLPLSPPSQAFEWRDLWQRPDQRGQQALQQGDAKTAAEKFTDPGWRGSALYRSGDYSGAAQNFEQLKNAEGHYNRGNALARAGQLREAIAAYDSALAHNPNMADAKANRELVEQLLKQQQQQRSQDGGDPSQQKPDDNSQQQDQGQPSQQNQQQNAQPDNQQGQSGEQQQDDQQRQQQQAEGQKPGEQQPSPESQRQAQQPRDGQQQNQTGEDTQTPPQTAQQGTIDPARQRQIQATEQWLRQIPDDPSGLLRRKFNYEHRQRTREGPPRDRRQPLW